MKRQILLLACLLNFNIIAAQPSFEKMGELNPIKFFIGFFVIVFSLAVVVTLLQKEKKDSQQ